MGGEGGGRCPPPPPPKKKWVEFVEGGICCQNKLFDILTNNFSNNDHNQDQLHWSTIVKWCMYIYSEGLLKTWLHIYIIGFPQNREKKLWSTIFDVCTIIWNQMNWLLWVYGHSFIRLSHQYIYLLMDQSKFSVVELSLYFFNSFFSLHLFFGGCLKKKSDLIAFLNCAQQRWVYFLFTFKTTVILRVHDIYCIWNWKEKF